MSRSAERFIELLKDELRLIMARELELPDDTLLTLTHITVSDTREHANVMVSVYPESKADEAIETAKKQIVFVQHSLNKRLKRYRVPKISFVLDKSAAHVQKIEEILKKEVE